MTEDTIKIHPVLIQPMSVYNLGTEDGPRLRFGSELIAADVLCFAIRAADKNPRVVAVAIEHWLEECWGKGD
jgi:hypothetical protein